MKSAVILNGGKSSRLSMGNKALLEIGGVPIIERINSVLDKIFDEVIIISNDPGSLKGYLANGQKVYRDQVESLGPLSGIYTGLSKINGDKAFICACDIPFLNPVLIGYMLENCYGYDVTCPRIDKYMEPLHAIYSKACMDPIKSIIKSGQFTRVASLFPMVSTNFIDINNVPFKVQPYNFLNVNTADDYKEAKLAALDYEA